MSHNPFRDQGRENALRILKLKKDQQNACEHRYGAGPQIQGAGYKPKDIYRWDNPKDSGFCLLKLPTGEIIGVCLNCQKVISSIDPQDAKHFRSTGCNSATVVLPESGQSPIPEEDKFFAQIARFTPEEQKRITKLTISSLQKQVAKQQDDEASLRSDLEKERNRGKIDNAAMYEMPEEELKLLAEHELKKYKKWRQP